VLASHTLPALPNRPACVPRSIPPRRGADRLPVPAGLQKAGSGRLGCGLLAWGLPASVSPSRVPGPFGRVQEYEVLDSGLVSKSKQHVEVKHGTAESVLTSGDAMGMVASRQQCPPCTEPAVLRGGH